MTTLTMEMILDKTKVDNADSVRHLNLWGEQLADVSIVRKLKNLEVLALATNKICSLKAFASCEGLQELYLRKNSIASLREVTYLTGLKKLCTLWLMDNPCAKHPYYREFVLHCCPHLKQLDNTAVTHEERVEGAKKLSPKLLDEIMGRGASSAPPSKDPAPAAPTAAAVAPKKAVSPTPSPSQPRPSSGAPPSTRSSPPPSNAPSRPRKSTSVQPAIPARSTASPSIGGTPVNNDMGDSSTTAVLFTTVQAQRAMLLSIVSLLPELTVDSLEMLRKEVQERLEKQREKTEKLGSNSHGI